MLFAKTENFFDLRHFVTRRELYTRVRVLQVMLMCCLFSSKVLNFHGQTDLQNLLERVLKYLNDK